MTHCSSPRRSTGLSDAARVSALDPVSGRQRWAFDPKIDMGWQSGDGLINRGLATWFDSNRARGAACRRRLFEATVDARLIAVDAATGRACADFGTNGEVSLRDVPAFRPGWYHMTSPPVVIDDVVVVGSAIDDNARVDMPSGVVRAFDARTGVLRWSWDPMARGQAVGEERRRCPQELSLGRRQRLVHHDGRSRATPGIRPHGERQP